jgi:hypothetical protein
MVWLEPGTQENVCVELYVVPSTVNTTPAGFVCTVTWTGFWAKLAVSAIGPFIVIETGLAVPE